MPMLRSPFVRLFGPIFGRSRKEATETDRPHDFTWRSDKPHVSAGVFSRKRGPDDTIMDPGRDSEEISLDDEPSASDSRNGAQFALRTRSPSGIFVRKEFSVDNSFSRTKSDGDGSTVASVSDDRSQGNVPYSHV